MFYLTQYRKNILSRIIGISFFVGVCVFFLGKY